MNFSYKSAQLKEKSDSLVGLHSNLKDDIKQKRSNSQKQLQQFPVSTYRMISLNTSSQLSPNQGSSICDKLTKIATQINIKDEWGHILIVDDNMNNIVAMKCLIKLINPELLCNYSIRGKGAEDLVKNRYYQQKDQGYTIIFMDIVMPEQDGITTAKKIKQFLNSKQLNSTKIIACSGYDNDEEKQYCLDVGMIDYLVKPVFKDKLASVIHTYF